MKKRKLTIEKGIALLTIGLIYFITAVIGIALTREIGNVAALWPSNAILIGVLLRTQPRDWPGYFAACLVANAMANGLMGDPIGLVLGFMLANSLEVGVTVLIIRRLTPLPVTLQEPSQPLVLVAAGLLGTAVGATAGASVLHFAYNASYWTVWPTWWIADIVGIAIITPLILSASLPALKMFAADRRTGMAAALIAIAFTVAVFQASSYALIYLVAPILLWCAFRLGVFACAVLGVVVTIIAVTMTLQGEGPIISLTGSVSLTAIHSLQLFLGAAILPALIISISRSIQQQTETTLYAEKERAQVTLRSIGDAVITTDANARVDYLNPIAEMLTGWMLAEARGKPLKDIFRVVNELSREPVADPVSRCLAAGRIVGLANHTLLINRHGKEYAIEDSAAPIRSANNDLLGAILVFNDVSKQRQLQREIVHQAQHDALTGLINRRELEHRLQGVIESARAQNSENALCYLDLDQFKLVNDTCGHAAGDTLLQQLTAQFQTHIRQCDSLARLGGDEFALLLEQCPLDNAQRVANALRQTAEDFRFEWNDQSFRIGASVGLVPIANSSNDVASILQAAESACYVAKNGGRNRVHLYCENDAELARRLGEMQWATRIQNALEDDRFQLYAQTIVPVDSAYANAGSLHCELLLRLVEDDDNISMPGAFMPAAERYDLAVAIDRWVIRNALLMLSDHSTLLERVELCTINLSGQSIGDEAFHAYVERQFDATGLPAEKICFEITETAAIANLGAAIRFIETLKRRGCRFSLDDFGSGLSSFAYLKNLPVDFLKIDGLFVKDIVDDPIDLAMVRSINEIGQLLGKKTIAEYVENDIILNRLQALGVDYAQGYGLGLPQPLKTLLASIPEPTTETARYRTMELVF